MIEGKQNILSWFESTGFPYWSLFHQGKTDSGNWVAKSNESEGASASTAYGDLEKQLKLLSRGKFTLVATARPGMLSKGTFRTDIEISMADSSSAQPAPAPVVSGIPEGYLSKTEIAGIVETRLKEYQTEQELKDLREKVKLLEKENKELEAESNDGMNKFLGAIHPFVPHFLGQYTAKVAGLPEPQTLPIHTPMQNETETEEMQEITPQEAERLQNAINVFYQAAPTEWLLILEKMAAKIQTSPGILNTLKSFL